MNTFALGVDFSYNVNATFMPPCHPLTLILVLCRWQKSLDSHGFPSLPDSGSFTQLPNGDSLETGSMPNPDRGGQVCEYEEIWRDLPIAPGSRAWIAKSTDSSEQGTGCWFGRVGVHFIALNKMAGKEFAARRLEFDGKWLERYEVGELEGVPGYKGLENRCFEGEERWVAGQTIKLQGREFVVLAVEDVAL